MAFSLVFVLENPPILSKSLQHCVDLPLFLLSGPETNLLYLWVGFGSITSANATICIYNPFRYNLEDQYDIVF